MAVRAGSGDDDGGDGLAVEQEPVESFFELGHGRGGARADALRRNFNEFDPLEVR